jgi:hypothetical protein
MAAIIGPIEGNFQPRECEHQHYGLRQHFDPAQRDQPPQRIRRGRKNNGCVRLMDPKHALQHCLTVIEAPNSTPCALR